MRITLIGIIIGLLISACSKNEPEQFTPFPKLTDIPWVMTGWVIEYEEADSTVTLDKYHFPQLFDDADECILDDTLNFFENRTYQTLLGAISCSPEQVIFGNGKWEIEDNSFTMEPTGYDQRNFTLVELSDTLLSFSKPFYIGKKNAFLTDKNSSLASDYGQEIYTYKH